MTAHNSREVNINPFLSYITPTPLLDVVEEFLSQDPVIPQFLGKGSEPLDAIGVDSPVLEFVTVVD
jgi:hypothetical protein